jgi:N4-gp56 family major capsid protein
MGTTSMTEAGFSSADSALLTNVLNEAIFSYNERSIAGNVYTVYDYSGVPGLTVQIPVYPTATAYAPTQAQDLTGEAISTTSKTITASEIGARIDVSDLLSESTARNMASDVGVMLGNALAEKVDVDAFSLFTESNITTNSVGGTSVTITPAIILNAVYKLRAQNAPTDADGDYFAVIHPGQAYALTSALTQAGYNTSSNVLSTTGNNLISSSAYVGKLFNVKVFMSNTVADESTANSAAGAVFSPMAFGHILKRNIRIETQRDASARTTEFVATTARGNAVLKENYACLVKGSRAL